MPIERTPEKSQATRLRSLREKAEKVRIRPNLSQTGLNRMSRVIKMLDGKLAKIAAKNSR